MFCGDIPAFLMKNAFWPPEAATTDSHVRYLSDLHPGSNESPEIFDWKFQPGSLPYASVKIPHPSSDTFIQIEWKKEAGEMVYRVETSAPIGIRGLPGTDALITINKNFEHRFQS